MQETWLKPAYKKHLGVDKLRHIHDNFEGYGVSAMTSDVSIYKGRPFGGTGFLFPKIFTVSMKPCPIYKHDKCRQNLSKIELRHFGPPSQTNFGVGKPNLGMKMTSKREITPQHGPECAFFRFLIIFVDFTPFSL